ncbi:MAG: hypothetical protein ACM3NT_07110 [Methylocystaceae bacterium]
MLRRLPEQRFRVGDLVTVRGMGDSEQFCIIGFKSKDRVAILKALFNRTYIIEKPINELNTLLIKGKL